MPRLNPPHPSADPSCLTLLLVLGAIREGCTTFEDIKTISAEIAPPVWRPAADLVSRALLDALEADLIELTPDDDAAELRFRITPAGAATLTGLLRRPAPGAWESLRHTWISLKLRFIHALDPPDRAEEIEALAALYRDGIASLRARSARLPRGKNALAAWLDREIARLEWELSWLDRLDRQSRQASSLWSLRPGEGPGASNLDAASRRSDL